MLTQDEVQEIINSINTLSSLVGRYVYSESAEEADGAQRSGFQSIQKLKRLKDEIPTLSASDSANEASPQTTSDVTRQEAA